MKKKSSGYAVLELNHSGIPDSELKPEEFTEQQKAVLRALPQERQAPILQGCPAAVIDLASGERITFNMKNVVLSDYDKESLGRAVYEAAKRFYQDPENVKKYEEWKKKKHEAEDH